MEELRPDLVRTELKGRGRHARGWRPTTSSRRPADVIPPTGVPWRSDPASPEIGRYLAGALVERIANILDREFPGIRRTASPLPGSQRAAAAPGAPPGERALHGN